MYSPVVSFGAYAVEWVISKADPQSQQNFQNSWEAKTWKDRIVEAKPSQLKKCEGNYSRYDQVGKVRVLLVDVQRKDLRINLRGYGPNSQLIDWGTAATWSDIDVMQTKYNVEHVGVDVQFPDRQQEAFEEIFDRREKGWFAIEGKGRGQGLIGKFYKFDKINPFVGQRKKFELASNKINYLQINSEMWKAELARKRNAESPEWQVYQDIETGYSKELFAEYQKKTLRRGKTVLEWHVKAHKQNHQFDLEYYHLAVAHFLKLEPYGKTQTRTLPKDLEQPKSVEKKAPEQGQQTPPEEKATDEETDDIPIWQPITQRRN